MPGQDSKEQDGQKISTRTEQREQESQKIQQGQDSWDRTAGTGQLGQDKRDIPTVPGQVSWGRISGAGYPGQDSRDRTNGTVNGQLNLDRRSAWTCKSAQDGENMTEEAKQLGQDDE